MPEFQTLLLFLGAALALNLTPGPDMLYVAAQRITGGVFLALGLRLAVPGRR